MWYMSVAQRDGDGTIDPSGCKVPNSRSRLSLSVGTQNIASIYYLFCTFVRIYLLTQEYTVGGPDNILQNVQV